MGYLLFAFLSHTFLVLHKPLPDAVHSLNKRIRWNFLYIGSRFASLTGASEADNVSAASTSQKNYSRCCTALPPLPYLRCVNSVSYSSYVPLFPEETVLSHRLSDRYKKAAEKQAVLCTHFMAPQKHALYLRLFIR